MSSLQRFILRLVALFRTRSAERQLSREVDSHLGLLEDEFRRRGMAPGEARLAARRAFGGVEQVKEHQRDARSFVWVEDARRDAVHAVRSLRRTPGFTAVAPITIALGAGATLAIFSLLNAVMLKTMPVRDPGELFFLGVTRANGRVGGAPPYPCYETVRDRSGVFSSVAAFTFDMLAVNIGGRPEKVMGQHASGSLFEVLGVKAALGRTLVAADDKNPGVVVLGYEYWLRRFNGDVGVLGQTLVYRDRPLTIVGVTEPGFRGLAPGWSMDVTIPITIVGPKALNEVGRWWFSAVGRLAPGVTQAQAIAAIDPLFQAFKDQSGMPAGERTMFVRLTLTPAARGMNSLRDDFSRPLSLLMGMASIALLIACANVANLLLARSSSRRHEFATRLAIGASRGRLVRQLTTESLVLGSSGTLLGVLLAYWLVKALTGPITVPPFGRTFDLSPDLRLVAFAVGLSILTSLSFGLVPALRAGRADVVSDFKHAGRSMARRLIPSTGSSLIVAQMALSLVLIVVMSLMARTLSALRGLDAGFRAADVALLDIDFLNDGESAAELSQKWAQVLGRIEAIPGVQSAAVSWLTPLSMRNRGVAIRVAGADADKPPQPIALNHVSPAFFATLSIPLRSGRVFTAADSVEAPRVAILNDTAARRFFGAGNPIGQRVSLFNREYEIVGVVGDSRHLSLRDAVPPFMYVPVLQPVESLRRLIVTARLARQSNGVAEAIRREIATRPDLVVGPVLMLEQQVDRSIVGERMVSIVSRMFGILGLVLAAVGLFGVMSFRVMAKAREIAVRMALGASASMVQWSTLRESLRVAAVGIAIGLPLSLAAARTLASLLFGVGPANVPVLASSVVLLLVVSAAASILPARRASRLDPMKILRLE
jgi:putative ABC transport system permease protein